MNCLSSSRFSAPSYALLALSAALLLASATYAQNWSTSTDHEWCDRGGWNGQECEVRELTFSSTGSLTVDPGGNGGVKVEGWDGNDIQVVAKVQAKRGADLSDIRILQNGGEIRSEGPSRGNWGTSFRIKVPRFYDVDLVAHNGGLSVRGVEGNLKLDTHNGGISLADVGGAVHARTRNGGLTIDLEGSSWIGDGLDAKTTNGGVDLTVPSDYSAELATGTVNGRVKVDFPVTVQGRIGSDLRTTLGSGGASISVFTTNGSVRINEG